MNGVIWRKYGEAAVINFDLFEVDGVDFRVDAVHASGDTVIMKDEGTEANTTNGFVDEGTGYSLTLTATEMEAARIMIYIVDQTATKVWLDKSICIETYGNASAQHAFDLDTALGTAADLADAVHDEVMEGALTNRQMMRIILSALAGITTNDGTRFRDNADSKNRITAVVDANENRTSVTLDGS